MKAKSLAIAALLLSLAVASQAALLQVGFYEDKCGTDDVESIIRHVVTARFLKDPTIAAALLRMHFHDCFVNGCDASLLLDGASSEKTAIPNLSVRGYDIIDEAKAALEEACQGVVSCADIIAAATRDAVALAGGSRYEVHTGRRDGTVSLASNVNLPPPNIAVSQSIALFQSKGLNATDMVLLLGGHTVGITHCSVIADRLYNFNGTGRPDPTMSWLLLATLRLRCPRNAEVDNAVSLDQNRLSSNVVDNSYYRQIMWNRGVLAIDQSLALDGATRDIVKSVANGYSTFYSQFNDALVKMGAVKVLTGEAGEIRKNCRVINTL